MEELLHLLECQRSVVKVDLCYVAVVLGVLLPYGEWVLLHKMSEKALDIFWLIFGLLQQFADHDGKENWHSSNYSHFRAPVCLLWCTAGHTIQ